LSSRGLQGGGSPADQYQVVVRVIQAKGLSGIKHFSLRESLRQMRFMTGVAADDRLPQPYVRALLDVGDGSKPQKVRTPTQRSTTTPLWDSLLYFDDIAVGTGELASCSLTVKVYDRHRVGGPELIGVWETDLESVYSLPGHEIDRKWLPLVDPQNKRQGLQGHILLSVTVLGSNDQFIAKDDEDALPPEPQDTNTKLDDLAKLMGGQDKNIDEFVFRMKLYRAVELPRMDRFSGKGIDAFVMVRCGSAKPSKSKTKKSRNPVWNQELGLTVRVEKGKLMSAPPVRIQVMDYDLAGSDDCVCCLAGVSLSKLLHQAERYKKPTWYPLFGAPRDIEVKNLATTLLGPSKVVKKMNAGMAYGSGYRGRLLMSMEVTKSRGGTDRPKLRIPPAIMDKDKRLWLVADVIEATLLKPEGGPNQQVGVQVSFGLDKASSSYATMQAEDGKASGDGYVVWNQKLEPLLVTVPPPFKGRSRDSEFSVFVNIMSIGRNGVHKKHRLGFARVDLDLLLPPKKVRNPLKAAEPAGGVSFQVQKWCKLTCDPLSKNLGSTSSRLVKPCGQVLVRLQLQMKDDGEDIEDDELDSNDSDSRSDTEAESGEEEAQVLTKKRQRMTRQIKKPLPVDDSESDEEEEAIKLLEEQSKKKKSKSVKAALKRQMKKLSKGIPVRPLSTQPWLLRICIFQAENLPASDLNGSSDPYAVVRCGRVVTQTQVIAKTTAPGWYAELELEIMMPMCTEDDGATFSAMMREYETRQLKGPAKPADTQLNDAIQFDTEQTFAPNQMPDIGSELQDLSGNNDLNIGDMMQMRNAALYGRNVSDDEIQPAEDGDMHRPAQPFDTAQPDSDAELELAGGLEGAEKTTKGLPFWWAAPPITITVYDADKLGDDQILSTVSIPLTSVAYPGPTWEHTLTEDGFHKRKLDVRWFELEHCKPPKPAIPGLFTGGKILVSAELEQLPDMPTELVIERHGKDKKPVAIANFGGVPKFIRPCVGNNVRDNNGGPGISGMQLQTLPVKVEILLCGVRGILGPLGNPPTAVAIQAELSGGLPLEPVHDYPIMLTTDFCSEPSAEHANFAGEQLNLYCHVPLLAVDYGDEEKVKPAINIRLFDKKFGQKVLIGTSTYPLDLSEIKKRRAAVEDPQEMDKLAEGRDDDNHSEIAYTGSTASTNRTYSESEWDPGQSEPTTLSEIVTLPTTRQSAISERQIDKAYEDVEQSNEIEDIPKYMLNRQDTNREVESEEIIKSHKPLETVRVVRNTFTSNKQKSVGVVKLRVRPVPLTMEQREEQVQVEKQSKSIIGKTLLGTSVHKETVTVTTYLPVEILAGPSMRRLKRDLVRGESVVVRCYVIRGLDLRPVDRDGTSDPYVKATLGKVSHGLREEKFDNTLSPPFCRTFEFRTQLPGPSQLTIGVYDWNERRSDVLIGETVIDLEDRWFNRKWRAMMPMVPMETRTLRNRKSKNSQGGLEVILEMFSMEEASVNKPLDIALPPPVEVELRVIVWNAENLVNRDSMTEQNDLFFRLILEGLNAEKNVVAIRKETDTHWLAQKGTGSFNYRLRFQFALPLRVPKLKVTGWDRGLQGLTPLGEAIIPLRETVKAFEREFWGHESGTGQHMGKPRNPRARVDFPKPNFENNFYTTGPSEWFKLRHPTKSTSLGEVRMQWTLVAMEEAEQHPVGDGQDEPNKDPKLPPPERDHLSLTDPIGSLKLLVGARQLYLIVIVGCVCIAIVVFGLIMMMVLNDVLNAWIQKLID